jgi:hypothetical protein
MQSKGLILNYGAFFMQNFVPLYQLINEFKRIIKAIWPNFRKGITQILKGGR